MVGNLIPLLTVLYLVQNRNKLSIIITCELLLMHFKFDMFHHLSASTVQAEEG